MGAQITQSVHLLIPTFLLFLTTVSNVATYYYFDNIDAAMLLHGTATATLIVFSVGLVLLVDFVHANVAPLWACTVANVVVSLTSDSSKAVDAAVVILLPFAAAL